MKSSNNKISTGIALHAALLFLSAGGARGWDQLGALEFNSHSVITYDAAISANEELRRRKPDELRRWISGLYARLLPRRLVLDPFPMGRDELSGGFFPEHHLDDGTLRSINRLQQGNTAADLPGRLEGLTPLSPSHFLFESYCDFQSRRLGKQLSDEACGDLPNQGAGMPLHFTREYSDTDGNPPVKLLSAYDTCRKSVETVRALTNEAWLLWRAGRDAADKADAMLQYETMYLFLGVASHAIEDAFAPPHTQRSQSDPRVIEDLCYYYDNSVLPPSKAGACAHIVGAGKEPRDSIYFPGDQLHPGNQAPRALATQAARAYLYGFADIAMSDYAGSGPAGPEAFLDEFLLTGRQAGMGYFDCETLARKP